jgi:hypothetical protein
MKKLILLRTAILGFVLNLIMVINLFAQATISGSTGNICPGKEYTYSWTISGTCTTPIWTVNFGTKTSQTQLNGVSTVKIIWDNTSQGYLNVNCGSGINSSLNVFIANVIAPQFTVSSPHFIACGAGSKRISVNAVTNATQYKWTFPPGINQTGTTTTTKKPD